MSAHSTIVLVTGANSGVGYAITEVLTASPEYHVIMAGRSSQKIDDAASQIKAAGMKGSISTLTMDVTDEASIAQAVDEVKQQHGRVDVLINNAGLSSDSPNRKKQYEETLLANSIGPVLVTEAFKPLILASKQPRVLHVTSGLGSIGYAADKSHSMYSAPWTPYRMSKAALNMYIVQNEKDLAQHGVKVFGVCPGLVRSNLRGTSEEQISAGGNAVPAEVSGRHVKNIIEGKRDADVGKVLHKDGIYDW